MPLAISKLRNQTSDAEYNVVESKLKDGITLKAFVADEKNKNATDLSKNFTSTIKTQKNVIDEIFNPDEVKKMQQFKSKALPSISNEIKDNPEDTKFIVASALDKRELLKNGAKQTLDNLQEPLIEKQTEEVMTESTPTETEPVAEEPVATESLQTSIDNFRVPSVGGNMFTPQQTSNPQLMLSPTVLPNEDDREIAMRQQMGIAGLV